MQSLCEGYARNNFDDRIAVLILPLLQRERETASLRHKKKHFYSTSLLVVDAKTSTAPSAVRRSSSILLFFSLWLARDLCEKFIFWEIRYFVFYNNFIQYPPVRKNNPTYSAAVFTKFSFLYSFLHSHFEWVWTSKVPKFYVHNYLYQAYYLMEEAFTYNPQPSMYTLDATCFLYLASDTSMRHRD